MKGVIVLFYFFLLSSNIALAHPGNTASDGCHYCRTNCDRWGVPWNERHCHNGGTKQTQKSVATYNNSTENSDQKASPIWYILGGGAAVYGLSRVVEWKKNKDKK